MAASTWPTRTTTRSKSSILARRRAARSPAAERPTTRAQASEIDEPAGLSYAAGKLYVADTNNHAIRTINLQGDNQVATLEIDGLEPPPAPKSDESSSFADAAQVELPAVRVKAVDGKLRLQVALELPTGFKINPLAPCATC